MKDKDRNVKFKLVHPVVLVRINQRFAGPGQANRNYWSEEGIR